MVVIKETKDVLRNLYGTDFVSRLDDFSSVIGFTLEVDGQEVRAEFNPDRPDLFSFSSLSNAIEVYEKKKNWRPLSYSERQLDFIIHDDVRKLRPLTIGFCCSGDKIGAHFRDLIEFQERIHASVGKDRSKVSIGIHDTKGLVPPIHYRSYKADKIVFTTYDGEVQGTAKSILAKHQKGIEYGKLIPSTDKVPIIEDNKGHVLSMPPVINGDTTAVTEDTKNFFIDVTGTDIRALRDSFFLLAYYFSNLSYKLSLSEFSDLSKEAEFDGRIIQVTYGSIVDLTGSNIPIEDVKTILERMGYSCTYTDDIFNVGVPGNRPDVMGPADVIEDIAKGFGYDNLVPARPQLNLIGDEVQQKAYQNSVREIMIGLGHQEIMSYVVTSNRYYNDRTYNGSFEIENPKSLDFSVIRDRLAVGMLDFHRINKRRSLPQNLFEVGEVIVGTAQLTNLCITVSGSKSGYSEIKQKVDALLGRLNVHDFSVSPISLETFTEGRSGEILVNGISIGIVGEVKPELLNFFELKNPVSYAELSLTELEKLTGQDL